MTSATSSSGTPRDDNKDTAPWRRASPLHRRASPFVSLGRQSLGVSALALILPSMPHQSPDTEDHAAAHHDHHHDHRYDEQQTAFHHVGVLPATVTRRSRPTGDDQRPTGLRRSDGLGVGDGAWVFSRRDVGGTSSGSLPCWTVRRLLRPTPRTAVPLEFNPPRGARRRPSGGWPAVPTIRSVWSAKEGR
jgi:hypothetical protein